MSKCIFIFRRDLRLTDNIGLISALKKYDKVLPIFIYDHKQIKSAHCSNNFLEIQEEALADLDEYLTAKGSRLCRFYGTPYKVIKYLLVGKRVWMLDFVDNEKKLYTTNGVSGDVSVIDIESLKVEKTIPVGRYPWGLAIIPNK